MVKDDCKQRDLDIHQASFGWLSIIQHGGVGEAAYVCIDVAMAISQVSRGVSVMGTWKNTNMSQKCRVYYDFMTFRKITEDTVELSCQSKNLNSRHAHE